MDKNDKKANWFARHKVMTVILAIIVIAIVANAGGSKKKTANNTVTPAVATTTTAAPKSEKKAAALPKLGEAVRDGKFEFIIKSVDCGKSSVGTNQYLTKTAQGQYCLVTINVKNIGDKQQYFSESDQKLLNSTGLQYSSDSTATLYNSTDSNDVFMAQINPGNSVEGVIVFDIPKDQTPVTAELHDSSFSSGVKVSLQ